MKSENVKDSGREPQIQAAAFSPDGLTLITGSLDGMLAEWDTPSRHRRRVLLDPRGIEDVNPKVTFAQDGREVEAPFRQDRLSERMRGSSILSLAYFAEGDRFAVGAANGDVVIWNAVSRGEIHVWKAHEGGVLATAVSPDGTWAATGTRDPGGTTLKVWRVTTQPRFSTVEAFSDCRLMSGVYALDFSPDGRRVAAGGAGWSGINGPQIYELASGERVGSLPYGMTSAIRYSPDGRFLAAGDDFGGLRIWDVESRKALSEIQGHGDTVSALRFSPDGRRLASGSVDGSLKVWNAENGRLLVATAYSGIVLDFLFAENAVLLVAEAAKGVSQPGLHRFDTRTAGD